jgi:pimeloyl-ACP methyl ester carboxylesterase
MTSDKLETRELFTLAVDGFLLRGTYHRPARTVPGEPRDSKKVVGVLFINPLSTPRTLIGDSAVYWATSIAALGYPAFRVDLPGLGDTYGLLPDDLLTFINEQGYVAVTSAVIRELVRRFDLSGVLIYGHCAGATTAIYVASQCKECKGLIVTDPYFNVANRLTPKLNPGLVDWVRRTKFGEIIRAVYARMREAPKKLRNGALPGNANYALVARWKEVLSNGLPILVLKAPHPETAASSKLRSGSFDYLATVAAFAVRRDQMIVQTLANTDHSFANQVGRAAVEREVERWLGENFAPRHAKPILVQEEELQLMETNTVTLGAPVPAYVSSAE